MNARDLIGLGAGNLRRLRLRSFLTVSGVVIAIGAFVAMLSFGAGNQRLMATQFEEMGLFGTMVVTQGKAGGAGPGEAASDAPGDSPAEAPSEALSAAAGELNPEALRILAELPGVRLAYPYDDFEVEATLGDSTVSARAQVLPPDVFDTKLFSRFAAGGPLVEGDADGVLVREDLLEEWGIEEPDSILGRTLRVAVHAVSPDSGFARVFPSENGEYRIALPRLDPESLRTMEDLQELLQQEAGAALSRFLDGYLNAPALIADTLTVRGVIQGGRRRAPVRALILPEGTARRFEAAGPGGSPAELLPAILDGRLFGAPGENPRSWSQVTLDLETWANHTPRADSIEALGWEAFSYAAEFEEIAKFFLFFNLGLGAVGFIALATASLGIVNTMLMSVSERRREIGILRSLGAEERDIRILFLVESGLIGAIGATFGVLLGWIVARVGSRVAQMLMARQGVDSFELFATPPGLVLTALLFGVVVSVAAGALPAARAARVDPVRALRGE